MYLRKNNVAFMSPDPLPSITDGIGNVITIYDTVIESIQDTEYEFLFGERLKGRQLQLIYRLGVKEEIWMIPITLDLIEHKGSNLITAIRIFTGDLSLLKRSPNADAIIRFVVIMHSARFDFVDQHSCNKRIVASTLFFKKETQELFSNSSAEYSITRLPVTNVVVKSIFTETQEDYNCDKINIIKKYKYGLLNHIDDKSNFGYLILPIRSSWNVGQTIFFGNWKDCEKIICDSETLNDLWSKKEASQKLKQDREARNAQAEDNAHYWKSGWEADYFDAMTDGQLGSYDDFEGNIDDLSQ